MHTSHMHTHVVHTTKTCIYEPRMVCLPAAGIPGKQSYCAPRRRHGHASESCFVLPIPHPCSCRMLCNAMSRAIESALCRQRQRARIKCL